MSPRAARRLGSLAAAVLVAVTSAGCSGSDEPDKDPGPRAQQTTAAPPSAGPAAGACYRLPFDAAVAPTADADPVPCKQKHTSETVAVGRIDAVADGHLLAVDSAQVQARVARQCPKALARFVGGSTDRLRLSMIRPVWFTPTVAESDEGAEWYRCDAVVLAGPSTLAELTTSIKGALRGSRVPDAYAMCGTAAPDAKNFERVPCSAKHSWRAIEVVPFDSARYPGTAKVKAAGRGRCEDAAADRAEDPLEFRWGYEWPTRAQWQAGQTYGRCWVPDPT
ncbi:septum formation family protein [Nocardioides sp. zg-536]|uniref:Septum formation family protein n=1 Tax=Nocardioides faecalis TaxID=2803858 RepID=A0A938Y599_9ACTN|nr:septum formation family protein [Nocardioides faecalis]MBM9460293.1 septum formation family protein [Nocardioides faecalis]QVI59871.1 septum formation family protein [Nocardioides faecalis]